MSYVIFSNKLEPPSESETEDSDRLTIEGATTPVREFPQYVDDIFLTLNGREVTARRERRATATRENRCLCVPDGAERESPDSGESQALVSILY